MQEVTLIQEVNNVPMISTKDLADMFERRHGNVLRSLRDLIEEGIIGRLEYETSSYTNSQNKEQSCFVLSEKAAMIAMPFIGGRKAREGQVRLVDEFIEYRKKAQQVQKRPVTRLEWIQESLLLAQDLEASNALVEQKEEKIQEDAPKVVVYDKLVADEKTLYRLEEVAKAVGCKPRRFTNLLRANGWLYKKKTRLVPMAYHVDNGDMVHKFMSKHTDPVTKQEFKNFTAHFTTQGLARITKLFADNKEEDF